MQNYISEMAYTAHIMHNFIGETIIVVSMFI